MTDPLWFTLTALGLLIAPGPTNALFAALGAQRGIRAGLPALLAMLSGYAITISIIGLLLAPLIHTRPAFGTALKLAAAAYLLFLAVGMWRGSAGSAARRGWSTGLAPTTQPRLDVVHLTSRYGYEPAVAGRPQQAESKVNSVTWREVFIATLLNPKGLVFALAVIPFGNPKVAGFAAVFAVLAVVSGTVWLAGGHWLGRRFAGATISRATAGVLAAFAALIAVTAFG